MGRVAVAITGAIAILLATAGLVLEASRGQGDTDTLEPVPARVTTAGSFATQEAVSGPAGQCLPTCTPPRTILDLHVEGLPDLGAYTLSIDRFAVPMVLDGDGLAARFDEEVDGSDFDEVDIVWRNGGDERSILTLPTGDLGGGHDVTLVRGGGSVTLQQIGAVEVSALADSVIDTDVPPGLHLVAWLNGERLGAYDGDPPVLDSRVERLRLDADDRFFVTLETTAEPARPGTLVFEAR